MTRITSKRNVSDDTICVSFEDFKEALGPTANDYTDEEINHIRTMFDQLADQAFNAWLLKTNNGIVIDDNNG